LCGHCIVEEAVEHVIILYRQRMEDMFCKTKLDVIKAKAIKCMKDEVLQYINGIRS